MRGARAVQRAAEGGVETKTDEEVEKLQTLLEDIGADNVRTA